MLEPAGGGGFDLVVSSHMLNSAASYLYGQAEDIASYRNDFNSACYGTEDAFGNGHATRCFNDFFTAWFGKLDAQAETLESTADATQQCAVLFDHAERRIYGAIAAMRITPPPAPASPPQNGGPFGIITNKSRNVA
jgi:uncharacterized protein YukE